MKQRICVYKFQDGLGGYFVRVTSSKNESATIGFRIGEPRFETRHLAKKAGEAKLVEMESKAT